MMGEQNRFFRFVWRINALLVLIAGLFVACLLTYGLYKEFKPRKRQQHNIVEVDKSATDEVKYRLGEAEQVGGTDVLVFALYSREEHSKFSGGSRRDEHNYMFFDTSDFSSSWLLDTNDYTIARMCFIRECKKTEKKPVQAIMFKIVKEDTDGNGEFNSSDSHSLVFTKPNGEGLTEVLDESARLLTHELMDDGTLFMLYKRADTMYTASLSLEDFTLSNENELPPIP